MWAPKRHLTPPCNDGRRNTHFLGGHTDTDTDPCSNRGGAHLKILKFKIDIMCTAIKVLPPNDINSQWSKPFILEGKLELVQLAKYRS